MSSAFSGPVNLSAIYQEKKTLARFSEATRSLVRVSFCGRLSQVADITLVWQIPPSEVDFHRYSVLILLYSNLKVISILHKHHFVDLLL